MRHPSPEEAALEGFTEAAQARVLRVSHDHADRARVVFDTIPSHVMSAIVDLDEDGWYVVMEGNTPIAEDLWVVPTRPRRS